MKGMQVDSGQLIQLTYLICEFLFSLRRYMRSMVDKHNFITITNFEMGYGTYLI